jgi:hypothetical protein
VSKRRRLVHRASSATELDYKNIDYIQSNVHVDLRAIIPSKCPGIFNQFEQEAT